MDKAEITSKVFYRPIEAAIRWAGLLRYEPEILASKSSIERLPSRLPCPGLEELKLYTERIYDAILNEDIPYGINGITMRDRALISSPDLTVRHTDLKDWMRRNYPEDRPCFLFSYGERMAHPCITTELGQAMLVERWALSTALRQCKQQFLAMQERYDALEKRQTISPLCTKCPTSDRAEATFLNIIGGLLELFLGKSPSGAPYSSFRTQEAVVFALLAHYSGAMGISERTLNGKFAVARRKLRERPV